MKGYGVTLVSLCVVVGVIMGCAFSDAQRSRRDDSEVPISVYDTMLKSGEQPEDTRTYECKNALADFFVHIAEKMDGETKGFFRQDIYALMLSIVRKSKGFIGLLPPEAIGTYKKMYPSREFLTGFWVYVLERGPFKVREEGDKRLYVAEPYRYVIDYLVQVKENRAVPILIDNLKREDGWTVSYAEALLAIGTEQAIEGLKKLTVAPEMSRETKAKIGKVLEEHRIDK